MSDMFLLFGLFVLVLETACAKNWHFEGTNIAQGKMTNQYPGTYHNQSSSLAVDGRTEPGPWSTQCAHTNMASRNQHAWWNVDLGGYFYLTGIKIYNRDKQARIRLKGFSIIGLAETDNKTIYGPDETDSYKKNVIDIELDGSTQYKGITIALKPNKWDSYLTLCEVKIFGLRCPVPPKPKNGTYVYRSQQLRVVCDRGFEQAWSKGIQTCLWNPQGSYFNAACNRKKCSVPQIDNGYFIDSRLSNNVTSGSVVYQTKLLTKCKVGYHSLLSSIQCIENGQWSGGGEFCRIHTCNLSGSLENGYFEDRTHQSLIKERDYNFTYGTNVNIFCEDGYETNVSKIECKEDGDWTDHPMCFKIKCKLPNLENGFFTDRLRKVNTIPFQESAFPHCYNESFGLLNIVYSHLTCNADGSLTGHTPRCVPLCKLPNRPQNGIYLNSNGLKDSALLNEKLYVKCNRGFEAINNSAICQADFSWSGTLPICSVKQCEIDKALLDQRFLKIANGKDRTFYNQTLTLECKTGYIGLNGSSDIRCNEETKFVHEDSLQCQAIECDVNKQWLKINFLKVADDRETTTFNQTLTLQCLPGYEKDGDTAEIRCNEDSEFDYHGDISKCIEIDKATSTITALAGGVGGGCAAIAAALVVIAILVLRRRFSTKSKQTPERSKTNDQKSKEAHQGNGYSSIDETEMNIVSGTENAYNTVDQNYDDDVADYYSFDMEKMPVTAIRVENLPKMISAISSNEKLQEQFASFKKGMSACHTAAIKIENRSKNKYKDMYPYDMNRVVLQSGNLKSETDYINASYINGFAELKHYIAAQAPLSQQKTINDFWRMIWQKDVSKIIMLTRLKEGNKVKCDQYWPEVDNEMYGRIQVTLAQTEYFSEFEVRRFTISKDNSAKRKVDHFHFTAWPDKGVPRYASSLIHFRQKAMTKPNNTTGPIVVHCSAGVGRTGTFIALDILVEQGSRLGYVDVYGCVQSLRKQRVLMVQTFDQYLFIHTALSEALMLSPSVLPAAKFIETYRDALRIDPETGKRKIETEYEMLRDLSPSAEDSHYISAKDIQNRKKNRYANILPVEEFMPKLRGGETYINAVFLPSYKEKNAFIITQSPLETTKQEFWKLVCDLKVHTLVMMNSMTELKSEEEMYWPRTNLPVEFGDISISYIGEEESGGHNVITLKIKHSEKTRQIKLLQYCRFSDEDFPGSPESLLSMIELVQNCQRHAGGSPVVVHCMNGADKSGLYCVISAVIERLKIEQDVAISQTIEIMRNCREQLIISLEQFKFCHDVVLAFINQFATYSNFAEVHA